MDKWDRYFLKIAHTISSNSSCLSRKVGAILVRDKAVISTGYNGPPRGIPHCGKVPFGAPRCPRQTEGYKSGEGLHLCPATHGEVNAIAQAARTGTNINHTIMYVTCGVPCKNCLAVIINAGVSEVVCTSLEEYDDMTKFILKHSDLNIRTYNL